MPVEYEQTLKIACDNSDCPGHELAEDDRTGWLFVSSEVYGQPTQQHVYCCAACASNDADSFASEAAPMPMPGPMPEQPPTPEPPPEANPLPSQLPA